MATRVSRPDLSGIIRLASHHPGIKDEPCTDSLTHKSLMVGYCSRQGGACPALKPMGCAWSVCLECRTGLSVPVWQPLHGSLFQQCVPAHVGLGSCAALAGRQLLMPCSCIVFPSAGVGTCMQRCFVVVFFLFSHLLVWERTAGRCGGRGASTRAK
jgi:hypothetical protein